MSGALQNPSPTNNALALELPGQIIQSPIPTNNPATEIPEQEDTLVTDTNEWTDTEYTYIRICVFLNLSLSVVMQIYRL
jgi:hypothetical protein